MKYFESHAHLDDKRFQYDKLKTISNLQQNGVERLLNVGASMSSSQESINLAKKYNFIYASVGVHPHNAADITDSDLVQLRKWASLQEVIAIGEIGLDFYRNLSPKQTQIKRFEDQLRIAEEVNLPVIIHSRDADQAVFDILKASKIRRGVIHCYNGSAEMAKEYVKLGYHIGVGGVVTYHNAKRLVEAVEAVPLDSILIETDCPYLPPVPYRGQRNEPAYLNFIVLKIAEIKNASPDTVACATYKNACKLFGVD